MTPQPPTDGAWSRGARSVTRASEESGLSRAELWSLMNSGVVRWFAHGGHRRRLIAWGDIVDFLDRMHADHLQRTA